MATKTFKVSLSLDNPRIIQSGINVRSFDKQSIKITIELTKNSQVYQIPTGAQIKISLLKLARQEQKIILDVPFTSADSIDWIVPDYLDGYQGEVRVGIYLIVGTENIDVGYFNITSSVSDIDSAAEEFTESVLQGWAIEDLTALLPKFQAVIDETTGKDVISAPEVILARNGEVDLKTRLDKEKQEVTAQLAQTVKLDGSGQVTYANLSQEVREQFTGGNTAVVGVDSVLEENITDGAVTTKKIADGSILPSKLSPELLMSVQQFAGMQDVIGGRNLMPLTGNILTTTPIFDRDGTVWYEMGAFLKTLIPSVPYVANTQYHLSYNIKDVSTATNFRFIITYTDSTKVELLGNGSVSYTTLAGKTVASISAAFSSSGVIRIANLKLVKGSVEYPYTKAPEDFTSLTQPDVDEYIATIFNNTNKYLSVIPNQIFNGNFVRNTGWGVGGGLFSVANNVATFTANGVTRNPNMGTANGFQISTDAGEKWYIRSTVRVTNADAQKMEMYLLQSGSTTTYFGTIENPHINQWYDVADVVTIPANMSSAYVNIVVTYADPTTAVNKVFEVKEIMTINLTEVFGEGNEPSKEDMDILINQIGWFEKKEMTVKMMTNWQRALIVKKSDNITPMLSNNIVNNISLEDELPSDLVPILDKATGDLFVLADNGNKILISKDGGYSFTVLKTFNNYTVRGMLRLSDGHYLLWAGAVGKVILVDNDFDHVSTLTTTSKILTAASIDYKPETGIVMYASYDINDKSIYRSVDNGRTFTEAFTDPTIRHWHSCQVDPYTGDWWITSGDIGAESKIYKSTDDGTTWVLVASGNRNLKGIRLVFTADKIMWGSDEDAGNSNVMVTERDVWNPISIAELGGPILGNYVTANGLCMMHMRCEYLSAEKDKGAIYLTDGVTVKEVFSYVPTVPTPDGVWGFTYVSTVDKWNRVWVYVKDVGLFNLSLPFVI